MVLLYDNETEIEWFWKFSLEKKLLIRRDSTPAEYGQAIAWPGTEPQHKISNVRLVQSTITHKKSAESGFFCGSGGTYPLRLIYSK